MSIIGVPRHNERINVILYVPPPPRPKSPMYVSEREKLLKKQRVKPSHKNMGLPETLPESPRCYLRKCCGIKVPRKEPLPDSDEYLAAKKLKSKAPKLKKPEKKYTCRCTTLKLVDSHRGHKSELMTNKYIRRKSYGTVPKYIRKQNHEIRKAEEAYLEKLRTAPPLCREVSVEERQELLDGLRHNKSEFAKSFLLLPILTDTIPKVLRKVYLEKSLLQIEKDVRLVEANPYIYVYE